MADAGDLYDEFGNYIGPELSESEEVRRAVGSGGAAAGRSSRAQQQGAAGLWMWQWSAGEPGAAGAAAGYRGATSWRGTRCSSGLASRAQLAAEPACSRAAAWLAAGAGWDVAVSGKQQAAGAPWVGMPTVCT